MNARVAMSRKKVLIISIKAGAGHLRAAAAVEAAFRERRPGVEVMNIEALAHTNPAFRRSFTDTYNKLATDLPSVWGYIYEKIEKGPADSRVKKLGALVSRLNGRKLRKLVRDYDPDALICTHYFPAEIMGAHRRRGRLKAPIFVTLTDYDIHTMWIQRGVDHYFVATEEMAHALREKGIGTATVSVTGIPIMPVFSEKYAGKRVMRRRLGLRAAPPTVLLAAGGFGMVQVDKVVSILADTVGDVQFIALAGRNEALHASLGRVAKSHKGRVVPFGFVDNMHELMAASDFIVTKCGGLTSSECLAMGLPMVILDPIPGQEERNSDFLLESGVALRANSPAHLVYKVRRLLEDKGLLARMKAATRRVARPRAAYDVVERVMKGM